MSIEIIIAIITVTVSVFGAVGGAYAVVVAFKKANIEEADLMTRLADEYGDRLDKALKRIDALETNIEFLNKALAKAQNKLDRAIEMIKALIKQLVEANIEPAHTLEELEDKEK